jgi:hypothetical protein
MYPHRYDQHPTVIAIASDEPGHELDNRRLTLVVILAVQIALAILLLLAGLV